MDSHSYKSVFVVFVDGLHQRIEIVDTTGDPQFPAMRKLNIQNGDAFVLVYSVTDIESFRTATALSEIILELKGTDYNKQSR